MIDKIQYSICRTQGDLYEWAANNKFMFPEFSDIYMNSDFCRRTMDTNYSRFQLREPEEHMDFLIIKNPEILEHKYTDKHFRNDVAYWIGFTYRHIWFETKMPSKEIVTRYPFKKMCAWYPGLHTLDEEDSIDRILGR